MGQAYETDSATRLCACGEMDLAKGATCRVNGDPAMVCYQVEGAPKYGREAHTERECYREVCADRSWREALDSWRRSLAGPGRPEPAPMPVGHLMFDALPGSAALSRRDNAARFES